MAAGVIMCLHRDPEIEVWMDIRAGSRIDRREAVRRSGFAKWHSADDAGRYCWSDYPDLGANGLYTSVEVP